MNKTDVCIVGAGPAGATLAHFLAKEGIDHIILDKSTFPRDKICGDGITVDVLNVLKRIDPDLQYRFTQESEVLPSWGFGFNSPTGVELRHDFKEDNLPYAPFYTARRLDLDSFLVKNLDKAKTNIVMGAEVKKLTKTPDGYLVDYTRSDSKELSISCRLVIGAEGEKPIVTKHLGLPHYRKKEHLIGAMRVYYRNVEGFHPNHHLEFFFDKKLLPGYFWAFPLSNGEANVGLGMVSSMISKKKLNLKTTLSEVIESNPRIRAMFKNAEAMEKPKGWGLPIITSKRPIAGASHALIGDAAGMIEPFTGKGIGPGMMSARICAEHIKDSLKGKDESLLRYQEHMYRYYQSEIFAGYALQKSLRIPLAVNILFSLANIGPIKSWSHQKMSREWRHWL